MAHLSRGQQLQNVFAAAVVKVSPIATYCPLFLLSPPTTATPGARRRKGKQEKKNISPLPRPAVTERVCRSSRRDDDACLVGNRSRPCFGRDG